MDKIIEKKKGWRSAFTKKAMPYWLGAIVVVFVLYLVFRDNSKTLRVDKDTITVSQVTDGQFNDYIRVSGHNPDQPARRRYRPEDHRRGRLHRQGRGTDSCAVQ